jgi:glycosyltransferase involved in cell wall biosynthesis
LSADLIIYHFGVYAALFDAMLIGNGRAQQVVRFHNITPARFASIEHHPLIERSFRQLENLRCADEIWADSPANAEELIHRGFNADRVRILPLAVDEPKRTLLGSKWAPPVELLFVGRFVASKGLLDLVRAAAKVRARTEHSFRVRIVGNLEWSDASYLEQVRDVIAEHHMANVLEIVGTVDGKTLERLYQEAHIFAIPSYHEGFCKPVVEALRSGCIPVGYASYNLPHIANGFGRMVAPGDVDALAVAMCEVIDGVVEGLRMPHSPMLPTDRGMLSVAEFDNLTTPYIENFSTGRFNETVLARVRSLLDPTRESVSDETPTSLSLP